MAVGTRKQKRTPFAIAHDSMGVIHDCVRLVDDVDEAFELLGSLRSVMDGIEVEVIGRSYASGASKRQVEVKLKQSSNMSTSEASKRATRGEAAPQITDLVPAMINGEVNGEQADVLVDAASKTSPDAVNEDCKFRRRIIATPVDQARKHKNEWVKDKLDDDELSARYARQRTLRKAKFWTTADGMTAMYAELDPILGERMRRRVEARADAMYHADGGRDVPASEHTRTRTQRMADALADVILGDSADEIAQNRGGRDDRRPLIVVSATVDHLSGKASGPAELVGTGPIPQAMLEYLACDSDLIGMIFDGSGQNLWQGRKYRHATQAQWLALVARDGGCVECGAHHTSCEAHHLIPWTASAMGETDIENLALLCVRCHHAVHANKLTLYRAQDGTWKTRRATTDEVAPDSPGSVSPTKQDRSRPAPEPQSAARSEYNQLQIE